MSTIKFNQWQNTDGTENFKVRAWVNFNGTGTVAIRAAGNVSSITDNGVGDYSVNFATALSDANYALVLGGGQASAGFIPFLRYSTTAPTTSSARIGFSSSAFGSTDSDQVNLVVLR